MGKKGELSIKLIVVLIISLIVLVIVIAMFANQFIGVNKSLSSCAGKGGSCPASPYECNGPVLQYTDCSLQDSMNKNGVCCLDEESSSGSTGIDNGKYTGYEVI